MYPLCTSRWFPQLYTRHQNLGLPNPPPLPPVWISAPKIKSAKTSPHFLSHCISVKMTTALFPLLSVTLIPTSIYLLSHKNSVSDQSFLVSCSTLVVQCSAQSSPPSAPVHEATVHWIGVASELPSRPDTLWGSRLGSWVWRRVGCLLYRPSP